MRALYVIIALAFAWVLFLLLGSMGAKVQAEPDRAPLQHTRYQVALFIDPDTGCHYLIRDTVIIPRRLADGTQLCMP